MAALMLGILLIQGLLQDEGGDRGPERGELTTEITYRVSGEQVTVVLSFRSHADRKLKLDVPAGMSARVKGAEDQFLFLLKTVEVQLEPMAERTVSIPAVAKGSLTKAEGVAELYFSKNEAHAVRLVAKICELADEKRLASSPQQVAKWALRLPPIGNTPPASVQGAVDSSLWKEIEFARGLTFPAGQGKASDQSVTTPTPAEHAKSGTSPLPGADVKSPDTAANWYVHGENRYRFKIPSGWQKVAGYRNTKPDPNFDTLKSSDGRYLVVCSRLVRKVGEATQALDSYREQQLDEIQQFEPLTLVGFRIAGEPALRLGYQLPKSRIAIWRMAVVRNEERLVINVVVPMHEFDENLPEPVQSILDSLIFEPVAPSSRTGTSP